MKKRRKSHFLLVMFITSSIISSGQTRTDNLFGLVYRDAISENVSGEVNNQPVTYKLKEFFGKNL